MTPAEFATHVRYKTRTTSSTFTDAQIMALMKIRQDEIARAILRADEDILLIPQYADLVASSITAREYPLPQDILSRIKRVEAQLNGTDWIVLIEIDITQIGVPISSEDDIVSVFNNLQYEEGNPNGPRFDLLRKAIFIYSDTITATTDGLRIFVDTYPEAISDLTSTADMSNDPSTTTHGIPRALHEIWARGVIIDYKESREKPIPLTERQLSYQLDLDKDIEILKHGNLDREVIACLPSCYDRGDNGFDY